MEVWIFDKKASFSDNFCGQHFLEKLRPKEASLVAKRVLKNIKIVREPKVSRIEVAATRR